MNPEWCKDADPDLVKRFEAYHKVMPCVWRDFLRMARQIRESGRSRYSAWTIINVIRWERDLQDDDPMHVFKINNDFIALYARSAMAVDPALKDLFSLREMKPCRRKSQKEKEFEILV